MAPSEVLQLPHRTGIAIAPSEARVAQTPLLGLRLAGFLTVKLRPGRRHLTEQDFAVLARSLEAVRSRQRFLLTAWVFLPDHWPAIWFPPYPLTIS